MASTLKHLQVPKWDMVLIISEKTGLGQAEEKRLMLTSMDVYIYENRLRYDSDL